MSTAQPSMFAKLVCSNSEEPFRDLIACERAQTRWDTDGSAVVTVTLPNGLIELVKIERKDTCLYLTNNSGSTIETIRRREADAAI